MLYHWTARKNRNEFKRLFPSHVLMNETLTNLNLNSYYIAGKADGIIYLGNYTAPVYVTEFNLNSDSIKQYRLKLPQPGLLKTEAFSLAVDSPNYFLSNGDRSLIFRSNSLSGELRKIDGLYLPAFFNFWPLSEYSGLIKTYNKQIESCTISKLIYSPYSLRENKAILKKQVDGIFDTDGMMQYEKKHQELVYMYYYRNQFIVMDSDCHLIYRGKTLDSNSTVKFRIASYNNDKTTIIAAPQQISNKRLVLYRGMIFIQSGLISLTEPINILNSYAVIDVYDLTDGHYRFSFYIPEHDEKPVRDFTVQNDHLIFSFRQFSC